MNKKEYMYNYIRTPEYKEKRRLNYIKNREKIRLKIKEYSQSIKGKETKRKYYQQYNKRDYVKKKLSEYHRGYEKRPEVKNRIKQYAIKNRISIKEKNRTRRLRMKDLVYLHYGGSKCSICGENNMDCLSIDHINNGGNLHRKEIGSASIYRWLVDNNFPEGYRVLCMNCQHILGRKHHQEIYNKQNGS